MFRRQWGLYFLNKVNQAEVWFLQTLALACDLIEMICFFLVCLKFLLQLNICLCQILASLSKLIQLAVQFRDLLLIISLLRLQFFFQLSYFDWQLVICLHFVSLLLAKQLQLQLFVFLLTFVKKWEMILYRISELVQVCLQLKVKLLLCA